MSRNSCLPSKCCFCASLRIGAFISAILSLFLNIISVVLSIFGGFYDTIMVILLIIVVLLHISGINAIAKRLPCFVQGYGIFRVVFAVLSTIGVIVAFALTFTFAFALAFVFNLASPREY